MQTFIFGHRNPDTDTVCASIALSYLLNEEMLFTSKNLLASVLLLNIYLVSTHCNNELDSFLVISCHVIFLIFHSLAEGVYRNIYLI